MKTSEADILIVPGWSSSGPNHWQSRWERNLPTARRVEQDDWITPHKDAWVGRLIERIAEAQRPVVLIAHSLGVRNSCTCGREAATGASRGCFPRRARRRGECGHLASDERRNLHPEWTGLRPAAQHSARHPGRARRILERPLLQPRPGAAVGRRLGRTNSLRRATRATSTPDSGHGPWPEGLLHLGGFMKQL